MQCLEDGKYLLMKKNYYSFKKKTNNVSTDLTTESVHPRNSPFGAFETFCAFHQYKKKLSVILNFRKQHLTGHVQRSNFTIWRKW